MNSTTPFDVDVILQGPANNLGSTVFIPEAVVEAKKRYLLCGLGSACRAIRTVCATVLSLQVHVLLLDVVLTSEFEVFCLPQCVVAEMAAK